jgi:hypothetical protein
MENVAQGRMYIVMELYELHYFLIIIAIMNMYNVHTGYVRDIYRIVSLLRNQEEEKLVSLHYRSQLFFL